jgi:hypothetical protein
VDEPLKENKPIGFTYTVTDEQVRRHMSLPPEAVLQWIEEMATFIDELQTPEERERKGDFKPKKRIPPELLRKDV